MNLATTRRVTAAAFVLKIDPGAYVDSWLIHPTEPINQRHARKVHPSLGFVDAKDGESTEAAFERKYGDWDERKDLAFLMEQGFTHLDSVNILSDEPSTNAPLLASVEFLIVDGGTIRNLLLADAITAEQYRQNQVIVDTKHAPLAGHNVGVNSHLPAGDHGVSLSVLLNLSRE